MTRAEAAALPREFRRPRRIPGGVGMNIRIPREVSDRLDTLAYDNAVTRSEMVRRLLAHHLERHDVPTTTYG